MAVTCVSHPKPNRPTSLRPQTASAGHGIPLERVVQHNHWSGKDCPNRIRRGEPYDWQTFLARVQSYLGDGQEAPAPAPAPSPAEGTLSVAPGTWNVRTGPGMEYPSAKVITGSRVLAYTEMSDGWYHIDGGWIGPKAVADASAAPCRAARPSPSGRAHGTCGRVLVWSTALSR